MVEPEQSCFIPDGNPKKSTKKKRGKKNKLARLSRTWGVHVDLTFQRMLEKERAH